MTKKLLAALALVALTAGCGGMFGGEGGLFGGHKSSSQTAAQPSSTAASEQQQAGANAESVRRAQMALQQKGLYNGPIDGIWGPETRTAVSSYQKSAGLPQTAKLDAQTMRSLESSGAQTTGSGSSTPPAR